MASMKCDAQNPSGHQQRPSQSTSALAAKNILIALSLCVVNLNQQHHSQPPSVPSAQAILIFGLRISESLGKAQTVTNSILLQAGYYCNVCDCILRDSQS